MLPAMSAQFFEASFDSDQAPTMEPTVAKTSSGRRRQRAVQADVAERGIGVLSQRGDRRKTNDNDQSQHDCIFNSRRSVFTFEKINNCCKTSTHDLSPFSVFRPHECMSHSHLFLGPRSMVELSFAAIAANQTSFRELGDLDEQAHSFASSPRGDFAIVEDIEDNH